MPTPWIEVKPEVMMGKPVFRGTRIPVELVVEKINGGETIEDLLKSYPRLCREAILAGLEYGSDRTE